MAKAKACPVCGSNKWRKDAISGNAACEEGHVFQDYRAENLVVENVGHTLQKRTFRKGERGNKRREEGRANAALYHGEEGEWLKLQALQLMLRLQVQKMREIWQLPEVFETIVRELWTYQLAMAQTPNPPNHTPTLDPSTSRITGTEGPEEEKTNDDDKGDSSSDSDEGDQTEKEEGVDPDILAELSDLSDDSEMNEVEDADISGNGPKWRRRRRLRVSDTLVTLILGLWTLRVPVMGFEIESMINGNMLPYLDFARTTFIPPEMFARMNRDVRLALTPRRSPLPVFLFEESRTFARSLHRYFGVTFPEINLPPISWRIISSLGGTPSIYQLVHRILRILNINLGLLDEVVVKHTRKARRPKSALGAGEMEMGQVGYERTRRNQDVIMPELSVVAAWVIVMKLAYGLDGRERSAHDSSDSVFGMPDITSWTKELEKRLANGDLKGSKKDMDKQDFPNMSESDIDRYLDKCETVLLSNHPQTTDAGPFPLLPKSSVTPKTSTTWTAYDPSFRPSPPPPGSHLQSGESIYSYDAQDLTGTLPRPYEVILKAGAEVIGVKAYDVGVVVELFERKLEGIRKERSRSRSRSRSKSRGGRGASVGRKKRGVV